MMVRMLAAIAVAALTMSACDDRSGVMRELEIQARERADAPKRNADASAAYLAENAKKAGVLVTPSGLQYEIVRKAADSAPKPGPTDVVRVNYEGKLIDGKVFDSSYPRNEPAEFGVNQVIPGWTEGLQLMRVGDEYRFTVPPALGYGERGAGGDIPPNSVLIFRVELLSVAKAGR